MRSQADPAGTVRRLVWVCLVLAIAGYGAVVVRNVTETLVGITTHQASAVTIQPA
jgi:hypothetical protein